MTQMGKKAATPPAFIIRITGRHTTPAGGRKFGNRKTTDKKEASDLISRARLVVHVFISFHSRGTHVTVTGRA